MSLIIHSRVHPKKFKSVALEAALKNLGKLPFQLAKIGSAVTGEIKKNLSGRILQRRSGDLHDSWIWEINPTTKGWDLVISSDIIYARIHEFGGFTGRNYATKIKKSRYVTRALLKKKGQIRAILRDYTARLFVR